MSNLVVRALEARDVAAVASFNLAMAAETEQLTLSLPVVIRGINEMLSDTSKGFYRVAETPSGLVGQIMVTTEWSDWRCGYWWWLQSVYVVPAFRRRGVFRQLHQAVVKEAEARPDVHGLRLYVERGNLRAQQTYEALGMRQAHYFVFESKGE